MAGLEKPSKGAEKILLAQIKQEFAAPAEAIEQYIDLVEEFGVKNNLDISSEINQIKEAEDKLLSQYEDAFRENTAADKQAKTSQEYSELRHNLRTPLNAIIGYSEILMEDFEDDLSEECIKDLNTILSLSRETETAIERFVDFIKGDLNEKAAEDYQRLLTAVWHTASYVVVNISSPNTPNLRELQEKSALQRLLDSLLQAAQELQLQHPRQLPILLKIAPDLSDEALRDLLEVVRQFPLAGLIATNTTVERNQLRSSHAQQTGGLSGRPLQTLSTQILSKLYRELQGKLPLVGVGGVTDGKSAYEKIKAGATLLQVYTGLVYQGPGLANQICRELLTHLDKDGYAHLSDAIGADHRP